MTKPILEAKDISKTYQDGQHALTVFDRLNLTVMPGETLAVMGPSGSGKTTLLQCLSALDLPTKGGIWIDGHATHTLKESARNQLRRHTLGFIFQFHHLIPELTALENVALPLLLQSYAAKAATQEATLLLEKVGLGARLKHKPHQLSGGERQRVAVARALVTKPKCILADEPTGNLDQQTAVTVMQLFLSLSQAQGSALVVVTHDTQVAQLMQSQLYLSQGRLEGVVETARGQVA